MAQNPFIKFFRVGHYRTVRTAVHTFHRQSVAFLALNSPHTVPEIFWKFPSSRSESAEHSTTAVYNCCA